jgi:ATP-binding cassette, subfamily C (CFTR/MRP), member 1
LADQIIVLGDSKILYQGTSDDFLHSSRSILKAILDEKEPQADKGFDEFEVQNLAQASSTDAAALNLTRKTGDLAVYGNGLTLNMSI